MAAEQPPSSSSVYATNHTPAVLRTHQWRTASNSAPHLLPHLRPNMTILDVGCGPGTITVDLARNYVPDGSVTGIECVSDPLIAAREHAASQGVKNVEFLVGDVLDLHRFKDGSFDVVHAHQVLQHVSDPVQALREMRRVAKSPGGIISLRESASMTWHPRFPGLDKWYSIYQRVAKARGGNPDPGSHLLRVWVQEAGFDRSKMTSSTGTWCFRTEEERAWWSGVWMERVVSEAFVRGALEAGVCKGKEELEEVREAWREWGMCEGGWFVVEHGEVVCWT
ncbi:hypothetical protein VTN00DRAFT_7680 [Thermoascus crustaceus]|uniref:uncharacterized protein n=1 Tax=Thermoascus crustaceus TaxID=5088 RepID=UPI0037449224